MSSDAVADALRRVVARLPEGEARDGQVQMAVAVADAIEAGEHLLVQAGTGTGKTLGYLVPAILGRRPTVVATATKALQEQLVNRDLPFLHEHLGVDFSYALLKGRSNYLCRAALADAVGGGTQGTLDGSDDKGGIDRSLLGELVAWSAETTTGDRSDLPFVVRDADWGRVSVAVTECPGRQKCSYGDVCFAEDARAVAAEADVVVVNTHLYGLNLATGGAILPEHDVVIVDEAHALEDVAADTLGLQLSPGRVENVARAVRALFTPDHEAGAALDAAAARLHVVLDGLDGQRVDPNSADLGPVLVSVAEAASAASAAARKLDVGGDAGTRKERLLALAGHLAGDVRFLQDAGDTKVVWVEGGGTSMPSIRVAPVDVGDDLSTRLFAVPTVVLTSATLTVGTSFEPIARRLGLDRAEAPHRSIDVGSPFDYAEQAVLYCAAHLPEPRNPAHEPAMHAELESLVRAAGGRTLGLFTSRRAMAAAAEHLRAADLPWRILVQDELPRPILQSEFLTDETSILLATMGFWQGFDAPGPTCSLVVIDRLPFARPDDPLAEARRAAATKRKRSAFHEVDLPAAAVLLAQGVGRLVRGATDRGVVAVLDKRLATSSYRWTLVSSLPPMRRTKDPDEVRRVLAEVTGTAVV